MDLVTLTVEDSFDALMGKRRGMPPCHEREILRRSQDDMREALQDVGRSRVAYGALSDLSDIAPTLTPEAQEHLRSTIGELVEGCGLGPFLADWRLHKGSLPPSLQNAVRDAVIAYLEDEKRGSYDRRRAAHWLVGRLFLFSDEYGIMDLSRSEMEAHLPLIEAVARAYRGNGGEDEKRSGDIVAGVGERCSMAQCLALCPNKSLPFLKAWRDELTREVTAGGCDSILTSLTIALRSTRNGVAETSPERKAFLGPLTNAIYKRRESK